MDITPWLEFGWPVALLVLVLTGAGLGLGVFLKAYLKQQKAEFDARRKEQERKDTLLMEQHEFIRDLATASIKEASAALAQMAEIRGFMKESTQSLALINEQLRDHANGCAIKLDELKAQNVKTHERIGELQRNAKLYA